MRRVGRAQAQLRRVAEPAQHTLLCLTCLAALGLCSSLLQSRTWGHTAVQAYSQWACKLPSQQLGTHPRGVSGLRCCRPGMTSVSMAVGESPDCLLGMLYTSLGAASFGRRSGEVCSTLSPASQICMSVGEVQQRGAHVTFVNKV